MHLNLSIKGVPEPLAERLRRRAERNHRSLQGELMAIIEAAAASDDPDAAHAKSDPADTSLPRSAAPALAARPQGWKTVDQLLAERRASGWKPHPSLTGLPLGADIVRADRDSR